MDGMELLHHSPFPSFSKNGLQQKLPPPEKPAISKPCKPSHHLPYGSDAVTERSKLWVLAKMNFLRCGEFDREMWFLVGPVIPFWQELVAVWMSIGFFLDPDIPKWADICGYAACNVDLWFYQLANCASWNGLHAENKNDTDNKALTKKHKNVTCEIYLDAFLWFIP